MHVLCCLYEVPVNEVEQSMQEKDAWRQRRLCSSSFAFFNVSWQKSQTKDTMLSSLNLQTGLSCKVVGVVDTSDWPT
jgi:hypothetical protein